MAGSDAQHHELIVIGAGPGGYAAAFRAADRGMAVAMIDPRAHPGGVCLHTGCIPSKALLHVARLIREAEQAEAWGVHFGGARIDLDTLRNHTHGIVERLTRGLGELGSRRGIEHIRGTARFTGQGTVEVTDANGRARALSFDHAVIATGSCAKSLPGLELDSSDVIEAADALSLPEVPRRMLVVGGGYIGLEMGSVYAALGAKVSLVEITPGLLPGVDRDLADVLHKHAQEQLEEVLLRTRIVDSKRYAQGLEVKLQDADGNQSTRRFQKILLAVGRAPNAEGLGLDATAIKTDAQGFIQIDGQCRTGEKNVYAIGDVAGEPMLAHKAAAEARVAVEAILGEPTAYDPAAIPAVVFTDPELAWTGLTETAARQAGTEVRITKFPWAASGRAITLDRPAGLTKLVIEPRTGRLLGMGVVGAGAGELIAEATLAIEMGALAEDIARTVHPHPTLGETVMEAAELFLGHTTHYHPKQTGQ